MGVPKCWMLAFYASVTLVSYHISIELGMFRQWRFNGIDQRDEVAAEQLPQNAATYSIITNEYYDTTCSAGLRQNSSSSSMVISDVLFCRKEYSNIISAFGMYCNDLSLYWFHRLISSQTLLSVTVPKHIFVYIHNMANATMCNGYNAHKPLYYSFADYISTYFNGKLKIHLYFADEMHSDSYWRNFLTQKVNEYIIDHPEQGTDLSSEYYGQTVVQLFDADDIVHPQKLQLMDLVYSSIAINGTVLHAFERRKCRTYLDAQTETEFDRFFAAMHMMNDSEISSHNQNAQLFYVAQSEHLLKRFKFDRFDTESIASNLSQLVLSMNKQTITERDLLPLLLTESLMVWRIAMIISGGIEHHQGWPTTTLSALLATPYDTEYTLGEDQIFNIATINAGYDFYSFAQNLGVYCQGYMKNKMAYGGD